MRRNKHTLTNLKNKKLPLVINLFGGPGCGKSTQAAYIFSRLKMLGLNVELVTEVAKDFVWEHNEKSLGCQPYIFGKQSYRLDRCKDEVDIIVSDCPLILSAFYNYDKGIEPEFTKTVVKKFKTYNNLNFFVNRVSHEYELKGRIHTQEEAFTIDQQLKSKLKKFHIPFTYIDGKIEEVEKIISWIKENFPNNDNTKKEEDLS